MIKISIATAIIAVAMVSAFAVLSMVMVMPVHATREQYDIGWRQGYSDHVKCGLFLNLALSPDYSQGYLDGWNSWTQC
jgi:hypothetical protein